MSLNLNLNKFWKKRSVTITEYDPTYKVTYLGNVLTAWAKGDGCVDKPLSTLWRSYCQSLKPDVSMKVTVCTSGLKATTKEHGLTEYWSNRITYCCSHPQYPKVFCWVYRHEGRKLKQELRCHAVLCSREETGRQMAAQLRLKLSQALYEFRKEKICRQNARLSLANCVYDNPSLPRRKILLSTGTVNYRPPIDRCRSAPRLGAIEESQEEASLDHGTSSSLASSSSSSAGSYGKGYYGAMKAATAAFASRRLTVPLSSACASNLSNLRCNGNVQGNNMMNMRNGGRRFTADNDLSYLCHRQKRQFGVNELDSIVVDVVVEEDEEVDLEEDDDDDDDEEEEEEEATSDIVTDEDNVSDRFASYEDQDQDPDADSVEESPAGRTERLTSIDENAEDNDDDDDDEGEEVEDDEDDDLDRGVVVMVDNRNGFKTDLGNMQDTLMVGACRADEDNVSDESGYSEENDRDFNCKM